MQHISEQQDKATKMLSDGLQKNAGQMTTGILSPSQHEAAKGRHGTEQSSALWPSSEKPNFQIQEIASLTSCLASVCRIQKGFGKTAEEFDDLLQAFLYGLKDFKMPQIIEAFRVYIRNYDDIPTLNNILDILDPQFKPDRAMYGHLVHKRKRNGLDSLSTKEKSYIELYEKERIKELGL